MPRAFQSNSFLHNTLGLCCGFFLTVFACGWSGPLSALAAQLLLLTATVNPVLFVTQPRRQARKCPATGHEFPARHSASGK